jgi:hypothetical protein
LDDPNHVDCKELDLNDCSGDNYDQNNCDRFYWGTIVTKKAKPFLTHFFLVLQNRAENKYSPCSSLVAGFLVYHVSIFEAPKVCSSSSRNNIFQTRPCDGEKDHQRTPQISEYVSVFRSLLAVQVIFMFSSLVLSETEKKKKIKVMDFLRLHMELRCWPLKC